jgi:hypothetical protein
MYWNYKIVPHTYKKSQILPITFMFSYTKFLIHNL